MYFEELRDLELLLIGHGTAFNQLDVISPGESFHRCFSDWLRYSKGYECASGWAFAIESNSPSRNNSLFDEFRELVTDFLSEWLET